MFQKRSAPLMVVNGSVYIGGNTRSLPSNTGTGPNWRTSLPTPFDAGLLPGPTAVALPPLGLDGARSETSAPSPAIMPTPATIMPTDAKATAAVAPVAPAAANAAPPSNVPIAPEPGTSAETIVAIAVRTVTPGTLRALTSVPGRGRIRFAHARSIRSPPIRRRTYPSRSTRIPESRSASMTVEP